MSLPAPGDWVHASDSREFDLKARFAVGVLIRSYYLGGNTEKKLWVVGPTIDKAWGSYKYCRRVTKTEGRAVLDGAREIRFERGQGKKQPLGDQIRAFLREEARKLRETV